ncbi:uncharacterized protein LOC126992423 [Eriocheir sinensis]|uniref:uncharacterized protein LOC126992423 n=1 Tax=Eriocheir sinensis TaxID=95602 RepID=UPI0021C8C7B8|nr:uncharacterized protein LOC126992423 [Eriocheir sinensis]
MRLQQPLTTEVQFLACTKEIREHGVGFAVKNTLLGTITPPTDGTERILSLQLNTSVGPATLISAYAPTLTSSTEAKDRFYDDLSFTISRVPEKEPLFILGDFNARVGAGYTSWPTCLGHFGTGKMNENGQRLLEFCCHHGLCVSNTFFDTKPQHKVSWRHPRSKHWHQLDLILSRRSNLPSIKLTRSYQSADCDTDHSLVCSKVKLQARKLHRTKKDGRPRIDTSKSQNKERVDDFARILEESLPGPSSETACDRWEHFRDVVYNAAISTFGKKTSKSADWFEVHSEEIMPVIEEKRNALAAYKANPSERNLQVLRSARSKVQQCARRCANDYWLQLSSQIQTAADTGNMKEMYDGIKQALGPTKKKTAPLKSTTGEVIQDRSKQMDRWVEHYSELYSRENTVTEDALNAIECLPVLEELDREPTLAELNEALDSLAHGKAPGKDGISAEVLKCCKGTIITELHEILCLCWKEGEVPQDMRDANIVTLSTIDMVFSLRQLQEKCREQRQPLFIAFIDLTKAFDLVSRDGLFKILPKIVMLKHAFGPTTEGIYLRTRSDGKLFNLSRLRAKSKVQRKCVRDFLFADDAAVTAHSAEGLQQLMIRFNEACDDFGLTISLKKTQVMGQDVDQPPDIRIADHRLDVVHDFVYLGSTISDSLSRCGAEQTDRESWTLRARQERKLNSLHMRCLRRILNITWQDKITNNTVLERAGMTSMFTLLKQRRMRWLGHVVRMDDGRIPKDLLYGELTEGTRPTGRPKLRYKDVCKRDLKALHINTDSWEDTASERSAWRQAIQQGLHVFEETLAQQSEAKRQRRKAQNPADQPASIFTCDQCGRDCHSRIGLSSHTRRCT